MELVFTLLLVFLTVSGYSYVLQPRLTVTQIAELDGDPLSELRGEQLRDVFISAEENEKLAKSTERRKTEEEERTSEGLTSETNTEKKRTEGKNTEGLGEILDINKGYEEGKEERLTIGTFSKSLGEERKREEFSKTNMKDLDRGRGEINEEMVKEILTDNTKSLETTNTLHSRKGEDDEMLQKFKESDRMDKMRQEIEEERESMLVAGISLPGEIRGENVEEKGGNEERENIKNAKHDELAEREKADHIGVSNLAPPLSTSSTQLVKEVEVPETIQVITHSQNPPPVHHNVLSSPLTPTHVPSFSSQSPTHEAKVSPRFLPRSVELPNPAAINHVSVSTVTPDEVRSSSLFEDVLTEVLHSPGHHLKQNELEGRSDPKLEDVIVKNILFKPAQKELQTTGETNITQDEFVPKVQPKPTEFITQDVESKEPNSTSESNENNPTAEPVELTHKPNVAQATGKPKTAQRTENDTKLTAKQNKPAPPRPQLTKPSAKTPSTRPTKSNSSSKNKTTKKSKEKKRKKDNKTQKPQEKKKKVVTPTYFPYFLDNYCPPECACYGRVVQCSDKGVDKIPYGIPYNARYILLMNNQIDSIQLDLLNEYVSMEFLVLSNNRLTDGAIEGAFEGIPALKRLYLDRNLLQSVPTDLPFSLEVLRLDNNQLSVMSEAAWASCPGLLVLSLSNNSLGNGSDPLPNAVLSPLSNLRTLNLDYNQLTSVPLSLPLSVKELYLKGNLIEQFRSGVFNGRSALVVLDLSANRMTNKGLLKESLLNATHLESLNLEGNRLKQVPRHLPRSLKTLNLEGNLISSIKKAALSGLKNLEHLGLAKNKIFKVAPGAFKTLPVLHQLDLCHNTLHQVPRQLPQTLHSVALAHNKIQSVPRDAFCWGDKSLSLSGLVRVQLEYNLIDMGKLDAQAFRCLRGFQVVHFY
ncbi:Podocan Precursor [Collichthys lucidus]|uniref:Podocan n=1 Tax=Collichthys lucidus TaxID=240159 RepID=A0A4U5VQG9_COLLU|nr:Podocan Precursor [Collichthys lucidus]